MSSANLGCPTMTMLFPCERKRLYIPRFSLKPLRSCENNRRNYASGRANQSVAKETQNLLPEPHCADSTSRRSVSPVFEETGRPAVRQSFLRIASSFNRASGFVCKSASWWSVWTYNGRKTPSST